MDHPATKIATFANGISAPVLESLATEIRFRFACCCACQNLQCPSALA